jgi:putative PIN family toxin of toxin-antitoxin system
MTDQLKWVIDTNLLISRLLAPRGVAAQAVDHALSQGVLLVSEATLAELVEVLWRPKFDRYLTREDRDRFLMVLAGVSRQVHITRQFDVCRDARDNKFLDLAFNGQANALLTGDQDLLVLREFQGVSIVTASDFLAL